MSAAAAREPVLRLTGATKLYQGTAAINGIDFDVQPGEVHALVGENGAGKSTLCKVICGATTLTSGELVYEGRARSFGSPQDALNLGIAMVYQETSLVPTMTAAQNIHLGREPMFSTHRSLNIRAQHLLQSMNFSVDPKALVSTLGTAKRQMVEITRAIYFGARLIIFDEPSASLTPEEIQHLFLLIEDLRRRGVAVIYISHALEEALSIADRITVLRDGRKVQTVRAKETTRDDIVRMMVGREIIKARASERRIRQPGDLVLSVENVVSGTMVRNMTFTVFAGQVTTIAGLVGSGRTEIAKVIAGGMKRRRLRGGTIKLEGRPVRYRVPTQGVRDGIVYVTEDRKIDGFFETMSVSENIYLGHLAGGNERLLTSRRRESALSKEWSDRLHIAAINRDARVIELSGGNQQKVVIAKSMVQQPKLVIFDEPTRGVDVGAIEEIHKLIGKLADEGVAVLVISSYLPEVISISDRILVARSGRIVEQFDAAAATEEKIMFAAIH